LNITRDCGKTPSSVLLLKQAEENVTTKRDLALKGGDAINRNIGIYTYVYAMPGKVDNFYPNQLIELINKNMRKRVQIGKIDFVKKLLILRNRRCSSGNLLWIPLNKASLNGRSIFC